MAASYYNLDDAIEHFLDSNSPFFVISEDKKNTFFANTVISDLDEAAVKLRTKLEGREHSKPYHIFCYEKLTKGGIDITSKTPCVYFSYQKSKPDYNPGFNSDRGIYEMLRSTQEEMRDLKATLARMEMERLSGLDDDDEQGLSNSMEPANVIGNLLGNPAIQNVLVNLLTNIAANFATAPQQIPAQNFNTMRQVKQPIAMAGTNPKSSEDLERELAETLEAIFEKGVTLEHLKKIAAMPKMKIQGILMMLN